MGARTEAAQVAPGITRFTVWRDGQKPVVFMGKLGKRECGARCTSSLGPSCSCTCGGHNHGLDLRS